ncbi:hypothetical protein PVAND_015567 [Polypedilum vanderplanki]|uniref:F-box domain-containing protein n=1 Tax=Polypedilum vanderplanki TaxID=319348 RepID=A0A9J6BD91_POLVA|nr:hypothetical protein PVAND_015567 [Polypedilum vanderplanki]
MKPKLDELPQEMLIEIFKNLTSTDLLSLSYSCRKFNHAINSCSDLMQKFTIFIIDSHKNVTFEPMRKYSKIFVSSDNLGDFLKIFEFIGDDLKEMTIRYSKIETIDLIKVFKICKNLKILNFHAVQLNTNVDDFNIDFPKLTLDEFYLLNLQDSTEFIFRILSNSQVKKLDMLGVFHHSHLLKNLLRSQKSLEVFKLHNQHDEFMLFDDDSLTDVEFQLKELKINNFDLYGPLLPFFRRFMEKHKETIEIFETNSNKTFNCLPSCTSLKIVNLPSTNFTNENIFPTVENLILQTGCIENWSRLFPNVKSVEITQSYMEISEALVEVANCSKVERLVINYGAVFTLNLPSLKILELKFIENFEICPIKDENLKILEEILVEKCEKIDWLFELLGKKNLKLKRLKIKRCQIDNEILSKNLGRIERLEIF